MSENQRRGVFEQQAILDEIANTIEGVTDGYKQIRSALLIGPVEITLKNGTVDVSEWKPVGAYLRPQSERRAGT